MLANIRAYFVSIACDVRFVVVITASSILDHFRDLVIVYTIDVPHIEYTVIRSK